MTIVGFAGLPSAGKSTMVNAIAGKRVLESGICRTTTEPCLVGSRNPVLGSTGPNWHTGPKGPTGPTGPSAVKWVETKLVSDDGVEFCALDLPGICDAEDASGSFDAVTLEWANKCDVVVWVTDARTALMTKHEVAELTRLMAAVQAKADEDGTLYQFMIVLAKYDEPAPFGVGRSTGPCGSLGSLGSRGSLGSLGSLAPIEYLPGEIRTETEHSTIEGHLARVERQFPGTRVIKFNAFARIASTPCSAALKALVGVSSQRLHYLEGPPVQTPDQKYGAGLQATDFELKWATENLTEKRLAQMSRVLRDTRLRLIRATEANAPRYDRRVKFHFAKRDTGSVGAPVPGAPLASVSIAFDRSIVDTVDAGRWSSGVRYTPSAVVIEAERTQRIQQIVAPTVVRPVFGDVYIVPAVMTKCKGSGNEVRGKQIGIHTGREAGDTYVLKVGEAAHAELHSLALALSREPRCTGSGCHASLVDVTEQ